MPSGRFRTVQRRSNRRLALTAALCLAALMVPARATAGNDGMIVLGKVTAVPAGDVVRRPARFFDLEGKTVTFTRAGEGRYAVRTGSLTWVETSAATGPVFDLRGRESAAVGLPFGFPFAGRTWTRVHVNASGNVSFTAPETTHWDQRYAWPNGTMRSIAAAVDSRSAAGFEAMIAVLWALYGEAAISVAASPERVAITWDAVRRDADYEPAGPNEFQVRLHRSGAIEFAYRQVSERDGIVGLFHGSAARGQTLSAVEDAVGDVGNATVDIVSAKLVDNGSTVVASMTMAAEIPARVSTGSIAYRAFLDMDGKRCIWELKVNTTARRGSSWCGANPNVVGYRVQGATVEIPLSKTRLNAAGTFSWSMDAVWWDGDGFDRLDASQQVSIEESDHDLSSRTGTVAGNLFEVYHYPSIHANTDYVLPYIYERAPPEDELALLFTDFRYDNLWNSGPGSGPINVPIQGIGDYPADPRSGSGHGSDNLLSAAAMQYVGGPMYNESGVKDGHEFHGHARGVSHAAHELVHRWAAHLRFRDPRSGRIERLTDDWCQCHWNEGLHQPERYPVWSGFSDRPFTTVSVMGGRIWQDNGDGTFTEQERDYPWVEGLSDFDLYVMGMIPPEEVRPTFLLRDVEETGTRRVVRATKVPVRIEDIVAALGPRVPAASEQRKVFRLGVYLLHEDGRAPRPEWLARAESFADSVSRYFALATGGRADLDFSEPTADFDLDLDCEEGLCTAWTGTAVEFEDLSGGTVEHVRWDFGDGASSTDREPRHTWNSPGFHRVVLTAHGLGFTSTASKDILVRSSDPAGTCEPDGATLCLGDSRYRVRARWQTADGSEGQASVARAGTNDSGLFWFFGQENWEILIKVLDGCAVNDHVWVFGASTTDLGYAISVTDTVTAAVKVYRNQPGRPAPAITDTEAFPGSCGASAGVEAATMAASVELAAAPPRTGSRGRPESTEATSLVVQPAGGGCVSAEGTLCLQGGRYRVNVSWRSTPGGDYNPARRAAAGTRDSGLYSFFDPKNWEMLIKVLDGCEVNGKHWVFAAAATDVGFRIDVTDTETDASWTHTKRPGGPAEAVTETGAFPDACRP